MSCSSKFKEHDQRGYTVLLAVGVLMGLLAIVTSLVRLTKSNQNQMDHHVYQAEVSAAEEMALSFCRLRWKLAGGTEMSRLQRNWVLPGSMSMPYKFVVDTVGTGTTVSDVTVKDIIPLFMALASHYDWAKSPMFLNNDVNESASFDPSSMVSPSTNLLTDDYLIVGDELLIDGVGGRGKAGVKRHHFQGERVYGVIDGLWNKGVLRHRGTIYTVDDIIFKQNKFEIAGSSNISSGDIIEYYPIRPGLLNGNKRSSFVVDVSNEQSRINLNGLSKNNLDHFFSSSQALSGDLQNGAISFPLNDIKNCLTNGVEIQDYLLYRDILTTYSEPDNRQNDAYAPLFMGAQEIVAGESYFSSAGNIASPTTSPHLPNNKTVQSHAVNINEASMWTLNNLFEMIGIKEHEQLAKEIDDYRMGVTNNEIRNPFDGSNGTLYYASPEEEFRYFLNSLPTASITVDERSLLLAHVDMEAKRLSTFPAAQNGPQISFEAGDIWRIKTHVVVGDKKEPKVTSSREMVVKHVAYTGSANIVLNNHNGWNDHQSAFYGLSSGALVNISDNTLLRPSRNDSIAHGMRFKHGLSHGTLGDPDVTNLSTSGNVTFYETPNVADNILMDFGLRVNAGVVHDFSSSVAFSSNTLVGGNALMNVNSSTLSMNTISDNSIVFDNQSPPFQAYVRWFDVDSQTIDLETKTGSVISGTNFKIINPYDADHYDPTASVLNARHDGFDGPTYETVLVRDGAEFTKVSWVDSSNLDSAGGPKVKIQYYDNSAWQTLSDPDSSDINMFDKLRMRVLFDHSNLSDPTNIPPQLFEIKVVYNPYSDAPENIVYMRR